MERYEIRISRIGDKTASSENEIRVNNEATSGDKPSEFSQSALLYGIAMNVTRTAFGFVTANYGSITGDNITQSAISDTLEAIGYASGITMAVASGNLPGALTTAVMATVRAASSEITRAISIRKHDESAAILLERVGGVCVDGGR